MRGRDCADCCQNAERCGHAKRRPGAIPAANTPGSGLTGAEERVRGRSCACGSMRHSSHSEGKGLPDASTWHKPEQGGAHQGREET